MSEPAYIHIHWHPPIPIDAVPRSDIAQQPGLYQVCGDHPVYGPKTLLYIGKSERQTVAERVDSESWQLRDAQAEVRVGRIVSQEKLDPPQIERQIEEAERLLIMAHKPSHNAREFKTARPWSEAQYHVMNWGTRGLLLPEVSEAYWSSKFHDWDYLTAMSQPQLARGSLVLGDHPDE